MRFGENVGLITVARYLRESLPPNTKVYLKVQGRFELILGIIRRGDSYYAELSKYPETFKNFIQSFEVSLDTMLYISKVDISDYCVSEIQPKARAASLTPVCPVSAIELPLEKALHSTYWNG